LKAETLFVPLVIGLVGLVTGCVAETVFAPVVLGSEQVQSLVSTQTGAVTGPVHLKVHFCVPPPGQAEAAEALVEFVVEIAINATAKIAAKRT
jgi:hypothetical protein